MKKIVFSEHALMKIEILREHSVPVNRELVETTVANPEKVVQGYKGRLIAQKTVDENHILRVVYEELSDHISVVTVYPGRRSRYEKD